MHIPKTAGHTFNEFLGRLYQDKVYYHYKGIKCEDFNSYEVIHGHFKAKTYNIIGAKRIAWIRHPVYRYLSIFAHYIDRFGDKYQYTIKDLERFIEEKGFCNGMLDYFQGLEGEFDFIGVVEHYWRSWEVLRKMMGWPDFKIKNRNINNGVAYRRFVLDNISKLYEVIKKYNQDDMRFYEEVRSRFV